MPVFTGKILPLLILVVISILYARKLSYKDYGEFQIFWIYSNILNIILAFALPSVILASRNDSFYYFLNSFKSKIGIFYSLLFISVSLIFYFSVNNLSNPIKIYIVFFILLQFATSIVDAFLIKRNQLILYFITNVIFSIIFLGIHLFFYFYNFNLQFLIFCLIVLLAGKTLIIFLVKKTVSEAFNNYPQKEFFNNWLYLGINEVVGVLARWLDKMYVVFLLSAAKFAIFVNGTIEIPLFAVLISAVETLMLTRISENTANKKQSAHIFKECFKLLSCISFPVFFMLLIAYQEAFSIIFNEKYNESAPIFFISIFIIPLRINHYTVLLQCYNATNKILLGSIVDIVLALLLMSVLYPSFGVKGVVLSIVISTYLQVFYYMWQSANLLKARMTELVPLAYLTKLFLGLSILYLCFFFLKFYVPATQFVILIFMLTTIIVAVTLKLYFFSNKKTVIVN